MRISDWSSDVCSSDLAGFTRVRIDGEFYAIEEAPTLDKKYKHDIEVVVDRLVVKEGIGTRLADSFETALKLADGLAYVDLVDASVAEALQSPSPSGEGLGWGSTASPEASPTPGPSPKAEGGKMKNAGIPDNRIVFSEKFACPVSGLDRKSTR